MLDCSITDLNPLIELVEVTGSLTIRYNTSLVDFYGLQTLLIQDGIIGDLTVSDNAYNPTLQDILDGNCSN